MSLSHSRFDIEIFLAGEIKFEFLNFLSESFKSNFNESLSWGFFRRFQLTIINNATWMNIYFLTLKNDDNIDLIINTYKILEKRSPLLVIYNTQSEENEKLADELIQLFNNKKEKLYKGIFDDETIKINCDAMKSSYNFQMSLSKGKEDKNETPKDEIFHEANMRKRLDYINKTCVKLGFQPSSINKKTKNIKRNENNSTGYDINDEIFIYESEDSFISFNMLLEILINQYFQKFNSSKEEFFINNKQVKENNEYKTNNNLLSNFLIGNKKYYYIRKIIDMIIVLFVSGFLYKMLYIGFNN